MYKILIAALALVAAIETVSAVNCTAMPDGAYEMGCRSYAQCAGGQVTIVNCPDDQVYNNATAKCDDPANVTPPCGKAIDCSSKADGRYPDLDQNCHTWYTCQDGKFLGHNFCPATTVFDDTLNTCNWANAVPPPCGTFKG